MIGVTGGTGFIGSHLVKALHEAGFSVRLLTHHHLPMQVEGIEYVQGNLDDPVTLKRFSTGCNTIIHLVGIIRESKDQTWEHIHVQGTRNLVQTAQQTGVRQFIYNSAIGASKNAEVGYMRTKAHAEAIIQASGIPYTIFRPSFVAGPEDKSINFFADLIRILPIVPIIDAGVKFQPVFIDDLVKCIRESICHPHMQNKIFDVGGPNQLTMHEIYETIARVLEKRRVWLTLHPRQMRLAAQIMQHLPGAPLTPSQLTMLEMDGRCNVEPIKEALGISFTPFESALRAYLS